MTLLHRRVLLVVAALSLAGVEVPPLNAVAATGTGYDVSWPQCGGAMPQSPAFGIVGATDGLPYSTNPCLASQLAWAASAPTVVAYYMNISEPGSRSVHWNRGGPQPCSGRSNDAGCAYDYGWMAASAAVASVGSAGGATAGRTVWVDVETSNTWTSTSSLNTADIRGALDFLRQATGTTPGVYSTAYQWRRITGGAQLAGNALDWVAGASGSAQAASWCAPSSSFTGGPVRIVQFLSGAFDGDVAC